MKTKRPLKWRVLEFALWTLVAIATAVIMVMMSETLLPSNF
ncbi:MAG TPA: hypothetical protein VFS18_03185 [Actinomycetota bacterium]|nr:hypothetical protein [Actinomycetota bacterium]